jgi:hypothetical protein
MDYSQYAGMKPYLGLPDIMKVTPFNSSADSDLFSRLSNLLRSAEVTDLIGVALLHSHFELKADEILVEQLHESHTTSSTCKISSITARLHPMIWTISKGQCVPLHWRLGEEPMPERINAFWHSSEFISILNLLNNSNRFGLIRLSKLEYFDDKNFLLERTDTAGNRLICERAPRDSGEMVINTAWYFSENGKQAAALGCRTVWDGDKDAPSSSHESTDPTPSRGCRTVWDGDKDAPSSSHESD